MSGKFGQGSGQGAGGAGSGGQAPGGGKRRQGAGAWLTPPRNQVEAELDQALNQAAAADTDEVALRRVWSRLSQLPELVPAQVEAPAPRRTRWTWIAGAMVAGAAAAVVLMMVGSPSLDRIRSSLGHRAPQVAPTIARHDDLDRSVLVAPATVRTANGEVLHLSLKGGTEVTVTPSSTLVLDQDERPAVAAGEVQFHVPPQAPGHIFTVRANQYRVIVVGTRFSVRIDGSRAGVGVDEGVVEVWSDAGRLARLTRGQSWSSVPATPEAPASAAPRTTTATSPKAGKAAATTMAVQDVGSAPAAYAHRSANVRPSRTARPLRASLDAVAGSPASSSRDSVNVLGTPDKTLPLTVPQERTVAPAAAESPASVPAPVPAAAAPAASDSAALAAQARAARAAGDARRALVLYRTLAQRGGAAGENAEYEIGKVLRDGLHQPQDAIAAWRSYRALHPRGLLRAEADISIIETLVSIGDKGDALNEALDFVRRFPDSERRVEMGGLAGDLLREQSDFRGAMGEYDRALEVGRGRRELTDAISYHRAICVLHEDREQGATALRAYLQNFLGGRFRAQARKVLQEQTQVQAARQ